MHFTSKTKAKAHYTGEGMEIFTPKWLDDMAHELVAAKDETAQVSEWFLVCEGGYTWLLVVLYRKPGTRGVYSLQHRLAKP